jgi:hypothetical protein
MKANKASGNKNLKKKSIDGRKKETDDMLMHPDEIARRAVKGIK